MKKNNMQYMCTGCYHLSEKIRSISFWKDMKETAYISYLQRKEVSGQGKKWKDVFH